MKVPRHRLKKGYKADENKPRPGLLDPRFLWGLSKVMTFGAAKYDDYNWAKGIAWHRLYDAAQRHLLQFVAGEDNDEETGLSHLLHAGCCIMMLYWHTLFRRDLDDRPGVKKCPRKSK